MSGILLTSSMVAGSDSKKTRGQFIIGDLSPRFCDPYQCIGSQILISLHGSRDDIPIFQSSFLSILFHPHFKRVNIKHKPKHFRPQRGAKA